MVEDDSPSSRQINKGNFNKTSPKETSKDESQEVKEEDFNGEEEDVKTRLCIPTMTRNKSKSLSEAPVPPLSKEEKRKGKKHQLRLAGGKRT